jgi:hypothetical protein
MTARGQRPGAAKRLDYSVRSNTAFTSAATPDPYDHAAGDEHDRIPQWGAEAYVRGLVRTVPYADDGS